jgi:hypothetical protein
MGRPRIDITDQRFGLLVAKSATGRCDWVCVCDCGSTRVAPTAHLRSDRVHSCGCDATGPKIDLTGRRFGKWVVQEHVGGSYWSCHCDCGTTLKVFSGSLQNGKSQSCGCNRLRRRSDDLTGRRFDHWCVVRHAGAERWLCRCDCGTEREIIGSSLTRRRSRSCGCVLSPRRKYSSRAERMAAQVARYRFRYRHDAAYREAVRAAARRHGRTVAGRAKSLEKVRRRQMRLRGMTRITTGDEWRRICEAWEHRCAYCCRPGLKLTRDHMVALSRQGQDDPENIVPACRPCNSKKHAMPLDVALDHLGVDPRQFYARAQRAARSFQEG